MNSTGQIIEASPTQENFSFLGSYAELLGFVSEQIWEEVLNLEKIPFRPHNASAVLVTRIRELLDK